jgi:hypothetical protein
LAKRLEWGGWHIGQFFISDASLVGVKKILQEDPNAIILPWRGSVAETERQVKNNYENKTCLLSEQLQSFINNKD